jgi:SAM-dependent methyltransferase
MLYKLKRTARRSKSLLIAFTIFKNWRTRRRFSRGDIESFHGSSHSGKTVRESLAYIETQFSDYLKYGSLSVDSLKGKRILELGFGDNLGVALKFLSAGAEQVVCIDKFYSARDTSYEREIYEALRETLTSDGRRSFDDAISLHDGFTLNPARLICMNGVELERGVQNVRDLQKPFDLVISRAVIEEIYQPDELFKALDTVLVPGGYMLHKIDLSDYGMFRENGMHPLTFLTISDRVYRMMASDSGIPNRKRIGYYRDQLERLGYKSRFFVAGILGEGTIEPHKEMVTINGDFSATLELIRQIRPALAESFRNLPDEELMIEGIFLVAEKPR